MEIEREQNGLALRFEREETSVLRQLLMELEQVLLAEGRDDPLRARLFPDAYDSADDQRSYEELVGHQLRDEKLRNVRLVKDALGNAPVAVRTDEIESWLVVLTDLRLALGTRLDVTEDLMGDELDPDDPDAPAMSVLHWLGWVQESMLSHLS